MGNNKLNKELNKLIDEIRDCLDGKRYKPPPRYGLAEMAGRIDFSTEGPTMKNSRDEYDRPPNGTPVSEIPKSHFEREYKAFINTVLSMKQSFPELKVEIPISDSDSDPYIHIQILLDRCIEVQRDKPSNTGDKHGDENNSSLLPLSDDTEPSADVYTYPLWKHKGSMKRDIRILLKNKNLPCDDGNASNIRAKKIRSSMENQKIHKSIVESIEKSGRNVVLNYKRTIQIQEQL